MISAIVGFLALVSQGKLCFCIIEFSWIQSVSFLVYFKDVSFHTEVDTFANMVLLTRWHSQTCSDRSCKWVLFLLWWPPSHSLVSRGWWIQWPRVFCKMLQLWLLIWKQVWMVLCVAKTPTDIYLDFLPWFRAMSLRFRLKVWATFISLWMQIVAPRM